MNHDITCPTCQQTISVPEKFLGQEGRCSECGNLFVARAKKPPSRPPAPGPRKPPARGTAPQPAVATGVVVQGDSTVSARARGSSRPGGMSPWVWAVAGLGGVIALLLVVYIVVLASQEKEPAAQVAQNAGGEADATTADGREYGNEFVPSALRESPEPAAPVESAPAANGGGESAVPEDYHPRGGTGSFRPGAPFEVSPAARPAEQEPVAQPRGAIADPDAGFDPREIAVPEIPSTNGMLSSDVPPEYLDQAVEVCQSFRFLPGTRDQYFWMQWLAHRMVNFQDELNKEPFEGTPERQEKLTQVVAHAMSVLSEIEFTDRRAAATNALAVEAFENSGRRTVIPLFAYARGLPCSTRGPGGPQTAMLVEVLGSSWSFVAFDPPENLSENESDFMLVLGFILTNNPTNAWSPRGQDRYYALRTYHAWEGEIIELQRVAAADRPRPQPSVIDEEDFDPSTVVLDAPQESEGSLTPASELDEALENCLEFRFLPANRNHYAWMQRLAMLMMRFERMLEGQNYRYLTGYQEQILASLENARNVVARVPFTPERMQAVNRFALEDMHNHEPPSRTPIVIYGQVFRDVQLGNTTDFLVSGSEEAAVVLAVADFADDFTADCNFMFMGTIDSNTYGFSHYGQQYEGRGIAARFGFAEEGPTIIELP